ncbi:phytanoyl-CoA dioxygenase family protein [Candidatus Poribacteria bacterium]|nr:phytanoyl-CoA dioxygenase family protein [Candidatus Poribacteria bacterium]
MLRLSREEILFFKREGYLIKRSVLNPSLMARARERLWENAPPPLDRNRPETWVGPFPEKCDDPKSVRGGYSWKFREPGGEDWMVWLLATDASVWGMAEQLLGVGTLATPERIRGIYCILPEGDAPERPTTCHVDAHPFHLGVVGYIDAVPPGGGGFTVWSGSHRTFYYDFRSQYRYEPTEQYEKDVAIFNQQPYIECHGGPGDIVFWHHRIGHSAGHNRSRQIRQAVLYDFRKKDLEQTMEEPPCADMWKDWDGIREVSDEG